MNGRGRPLRFVALVAIGWASTRTIMLWPVGATLPEAIEAAFPLRAAQAATAPEPVAARPFPVAHAPARAVAVSAPPLLAAGPAVQRGDPARIDLAMLGLVSFGREEAFGVPPGTLRRPATPAALPQAAQPSRWSASAWFVTRRGASTAAPCSAAIRLVCASPIIPEAGASRCSPA